MLIQSTVLTFVILLHLGAKKGYTQLTHLEQEQDDDYYRDFCEIQDSFKSPYIRAFYEEPQEVEGCIEEVEEDGDDINLRSTSVAQEIHVIRVQSSRSSTESGTDLRSKAGVRINLRIKSQETSTGNLDKKLIFVLVSNVSLRWKIHLERINLSSELHFWVTNGSYVVHDGRLNMKVHQLTHQSSIEPLLDWISQKLGPVTTIAEVKPSRSIVHIVGIVDMVKMCPERIPPERTPKEISGCLVTQNKGGRNKDVHILELHDGTADATGDRAASNVPQTVTVDIHPRSNSKPLLRRHLMLVLKSHRSAQWKVRTTGLRGTLDIVTDNVVDTDSITMQTVGVVTERLSSLSGMELVVWTNEKYGEPISYTYAQLANKFDLTVDGLEVSAVDSSISPQVICSPNSMAIGLKKRFLVNKFAAAQLSLNDHSCRAQKNGTHYFWTTALTSCGTIQTQQNDQITYRNSIVIHGLKTSSGRLSDESGSGVESSVHHSHEDDENFDSGNSGDARLNFQCTYPKPNMEQVKYSLKLYKDPTFQLELLHFPAIIDDTEMLYVEASTNNDPSMQVIVHSCIVTSPSSNHPEYQLIRNGCPYEKRIKWIRTGPPWSSQRFQLVFQDFWSGSNIECSLSTCARTFQEHSSHIQPCPAVEQKCSAVGGGFDSTSAVSKSVSIGPLVLPELPVAKISFAIQDTSTEVMMTLKNELQDCDRIVHAEGLDPAAVVGIAFAAFTIGVLLTGALWFIHSHTGPIKKHAKGLRSAEASGESTPSSTAPMAIRTSHHHV